MSETTTARDARIAEIQGRLDANMLDFLSSRDTAWLLTELRSALTRAREAERDAELWAKQATANAKDVLRMNWLEAAGGKYDLTCWNVDWPNTNNGWTVGDAEIDDIAQADTARAALDEAIAKHPEILAARAPIPSTPREADQ